MNIRCLRCGHTIPLDSAYDSYAGQLRCVVCKQLLRVRVEGGQLRSIELDQKSVAGARSSASKLDAN